MEVYEDDGCVPPKKLFTHYFHSIPNYFDVTGCEGISMYKLIRKKHQRKIILELKKEEYSITLGGEKKIMHIWCLFSTGELLIVYNSGIDYYYKTETLFSVESLTEMAKKHPVPPQKNKMKILVESNNEYSFEPFTINSPNVDIVKTYNSDLIDFDCIVQKKLNEKNGKGIVLLYGVPGGGKTSYIRYLTSKLNKDVLYIPSSLANALANPNFISYLMKETGSVMVIEDAEKAIKSRNNNHDSGAVSALLNISDGLLADVLKMQIICTFNTEIHNIDSALLRPNRLIAKYEFGKLCINKAKVLSEELGYKRKVTEPMTLAEIFSNSEPIEHSLSNRRKIGFGVHIENSAA